MNNKKIEVKTIDINVPGAGTIKISESNIFACGGKTGFSFGVSWGSHGFAGGTLPNDEALKLANHIINTLINKSNMKWTIDNINHTTYQVLGLEQDEVKILQLMLSSELPKLQKIFDKISDIRESGEATDKQMDIYFQIQEKLETLIQFLKQ